MVPPVIVLIDDEPLVRRSVAALLTRQGYRVEVAATVAEGLVLLRAIGPDLLLLDRTLPDGDGLHLLPAVRREWPDLPVLMITADPRPETRTTALRAGAVAVVEKPCEPTVLVAAVAAAFQPRTPDGPSGAVRETENARADRDPTSTAM